ncbi:hypothetical protein HHK36_020588 [Tetracentron sinense]|uniref:FLZ-type domain-containing protein n=1 Tax=Tetracentron sinense TaxID=13715 RepID=A0A834YVP0_TETSI|nr:hypothetical protein HHK36_020588 [Tetracentron sinense]
MTDKEKSEMNTDERYGVFLEACYYCKKKFSKKDDIFMYRYLSAFCTPECQEEQMDLDKEVENDPEESLEEIEVMEQWINRLKGRCIFELSSPVQMTNKEKSEMNTDERYGVFLEACYYCKKKFDEKDDIFMYRYLRAFCTPECREEQMTLDKEVENDPEESMEEIEEMEQ